METQIGQLATSLNEVKSQGSSQLPSQTINNPRGNVSAITLRSGKEVQVPTRAEDVQQNPIDSSKGSNQNPTTKPTQQIADHVDNSVNKQKTTSGIPFPFPNRMTQSKKLTEAELDTFQKVEVNIPLFEAIKQIPKYAKFLKDLCTH